MIPEEISSSLYAYFHSQGDIHFAIHSTKSLSGGDINKVCKIDSSSGTFCLKYNSADKFPSMFENEAQGLRLLKSAGEIYIPDVITESTLSDYSYLLLEFIDSSKEVDRFMFRFGESLARLHDNSTDFYGLDHNNYMGSLPQSNEQHDNWIEFFIEERLLKQVVLARDSGRLDRAGVLLFDQLFVRLDRLLAIDIPALLHGDLWGGNYMVSDMGEPCLIDPAVYFGHREVDLAMTTLFGGFSADFYLGYEAHHKLEPEWRERLEVYTLYPLLIHLNLFGSSYLGSIQQILNRFIR